MRRKRAVTIPTLDAGLPEGEVYDLIRRHALEMTDDRRLAFGSTIGGLWISDDQGDRWHCVSTHLPPVSCICFEWF